MNIPYDPDFDGPREPGRGASPSSFFDAFSSTAAFWLGIALAIGGLSTVGFALLLLIRF